MNAGRAEVREVIERAQHRRPRAASRRSSSSTRSTASTRRSRTACCRRSRRGSCCWWAPPPRTPTSRSTRRCSRAAGSTSCMRSTTEHVLALLRRALGDERGIADAPRGGRRRARLPRHARGRRRAHGARRARAGLRDGGPRRRGHAARSGGRAPAQRDPLRQGGRPPLRPDLGLDQGHARLGSRRLAALPGRDARGRRGPALHRPADGRAGQRGHRQRRPARARGGRGRGRTRWSTWACPRPRSTSPRPRCTWRWRRSRTPPTRPSAGRASGCASTARRTRRTHLRERRLPGREEARPRPGLRLPARPSRGRVRAGADARRTRRASGSSS